MILEGIDAKGKNNEININDVFNQLFWMGEDGEINEDDLKELHSGKKEKSVSFQQVWFNQGWRR